MSLDFAAIYWLNLQSAVAFRLEPRPVGMSIQTSFRAFKNPRTDFRLYIFRPTLSLIGDVQRNTFAASG
jgi:hypothetical protein